LGRRRADMALGGMPYRFIEYSRPH
jgi:hypothetical protein